MRKTTAAAGFLVAATAAAAPPSAPTASAPPNIIFILADDLGYNDISLHGSPQIPTPNIDALAAGGVQLSNYHAQPVCSPSRSSFLSGRHVIHDGIYMPFDGGSAMHMPLTYSILPTYLKSCCNYSTHLIGKWHEGFNTVSATPIGRGFDTHIGYYNGAEDHYTHDTTGAYDFVVGNKPQVQFNNTWSTRIFSDSAAQLFHDFAPGGPSFGTPFFLYLAYQDVHWPLQAPDEYLQRCAAATAGHPERQRVCAMAIHLDEGIGNVTRALKAAGLWESTLIVFTADNGGPTNQNGTRVDAIIRGAGIQKVNYTSHEKYHVTDWLPSLVSLASGRNWSDFTPPTDPPFQIGDGMDVWESLSTGSPSPRDWLLLEAHPRNTTGQGHGDALLLGDWKIIRWWLSPEEENGWFPPPGQDPARVNYSISCGPPPVKRNASQCKNTYCLFNMTADPCEHTDLAAQYPAVLAQLVAALAPYQDTAVPPIEPLGCLPVKVPLPGDSGALAWQPCDADCISHAQCNHGRCNDVSGACECAAGWRGFRCSEDARGVSD